MNRRNTVILVVVFLALFGYAYWTQLRPGAEPPSTASGTPSPTPVAILDFNSDAVQNFEVKDVAKNETISVTRQPTGWVMDQPKQGPAEELKVTSAIGPIAHLSATSVVTNTTDLSAFGLVTGTISAQVTLTDTTKIALKFGNPTFDQSGYYLQKGSEPQVYVVPQNVVQSLQDYINNPPYTPTPTFTPLPTLTPSVTPTITPTPGPGTPTVEPAPSPTP